MSNYYQTLSELPIKRLVEKKGGLDYLSWSNAWDMLKKIHPHAQRKVYENEQTGLNYFTDGKTAYVKVGIVIIFKEGEDATGLLEHIDYLPVMDFRNNSIPLEKITSMDVTKSIQRATAKAIAMHGLGLSLWTGEDIPSENNNTPTKNSNTIKHIDLNLGDENWDKVLKYVSANKELGLEKLVENLQKKYKVRATLQKEIKKVIS